MPFKGLTCAETSMFTKGHGWDRLEVSELEPVVEAEVLDDVLRVAVREPVVLAEEMVGVGIARAMMVSMAAIDNVVVRLRLLVCKSDPCLPQIALTRFLSKCDKY